MLSVRIIGVSVEVFARRELTIGKEVIVDTINYSNIKCLSEKIKTIALVGPIETKEIFSHIA